MSAPATTAQVPLVDYLILDDSEPYLAAWECVACGARFFDRRNACAQCSRTAFAREAVARTGEVIAYSFVNVAPPGIEIPFTAAVVDCQGTVVRTNLRNVAPDPEHVRLGMRVRLVTYSLGVDVHGVEGIGFGFEPAPEGETDG